MNWSPDDPVEISENGSHSVALLCCVVVDIHWGMWWCMALQGQLESTLCALVSPVTVCQASSGVSGHAPF